MFADYFRRIRGRNPTYGSLFSGVLGADLGLEDAGFEPLFYCEKDPQCQSVIRRQRPNVPLHDDVLTFDPSQFPTPDLLWCSPPCFTAGHLVLTKDGLCPIECLEPGDMVLTHKNRWRPVLRIGSKVADVGTLKGQGHPGIICTGGHPFYARRIDSKVAKIDGKPKRYLKVTDPSWVEAKDMPSMRWASPCVVEDVPVPDIPWNGKDLTQFFRMLGVWVGDGFICSDRNGIAITPGYPSAAEFEEMFAGMGFVRTEERTSPRYILSHTDLPRWIQAHFGKGASGKTIPAWLLTAPRWCRQAFFEGYCWADGSSPRPKDSFDHRINTVSKRLFVGLRLLAQTLGLSASAVLVDNDRECVIEGRTVNEQPYYQVSMKLSNRRSKEIDGHRWYLVKSWTPLSGPQRVFNIEVAEDNSYCLDGIIVKNCQSFSVSGARAGLDDPRGQLTLHTARLIDDIDAECTFIENVPGWLSAKGNAFGAFLGYVAGHHDAIPSPRTKRDGKPDSWPHAGVVVGPRRTIAYRVIDSQGFVPQRRRRVFVVAVRNGSWLDPVRMLFESEDQALRSAVNSGWDAVFTFQDGVRRDLEESRASGQEAAEDSGGGAETDCGVVAAFNSKQHAQDYSEEVCPTLRAMPHAESRPNAGGQMAIMSAEGPMPQGINGEQDICHTLVANADNGYDTDATGQGTPILAYPIQEPTHGHYRTEGASGVDENGEPMYTLQAKAPHGVAYGLSSELTGYEELSGCLTKDSPTGGGHPPMVLQPVGFDGGSRPAADSELSGTLMSSDKANANCVMHAAEIAPCLNASAAGMSRTGNERTECEMLVVEKDERWNDSSVVNARQDPVCDDKEVSQFLDCDGYTQAVFGTIGNLWRMVVRRLTPEECEKLQSWPAGWTAFGLEQKKIRKGPNKGELEWVEVPIKDGPRYRMCGNGVTSDCSHWLGWRFFREFKLRAEREVDQAA